MNGLTSYILSKKYVESTVDSLGAVKGAPATIKSITEVDGGQKVTFEWTGTSGTKQTSDMTVKNGVSITNISIDANNNLVCTMSDGTEQKAKINILDNVYTKTETDTLLLDKAEKNHNHDSAYASKDTEHEHSNKETLDKFGVNDGGKLTFNGDVVTPEAMDLGDYLKKTDAQNTYVEKETGKGLSENNFTTVLKDAYDKAVEDSHTHSNKSIIDKFSEDSDGKLLYDGQSIEADLSTVYKKTEADNKFVAKEDGKDLSSNDYTTEEKDKLASLENYNDTQIKTQIQAVANGLMDSVGYSADYKTIDIIAKNGVKKSVNVAPIISHASITELSDVDTTNKATGKALVYNSATSKHEYATISSTDEKVKMDASSDSKYLGELLDNITIANENGKLKVKKLDGQEVTITEINYLKGLTMNVMDLVNMFSNGGVKIINTPVATYAELLTLDKSSFIEGISYLVYVLADENHDNAKTTYLVDKDSETPTYFGFADSQRDFTTNPIDLATEITGKLGIANMDSDAIKALFTVDDTYKTETATNNAFSTHGAKALYDELLLAIGGKANDSDLTTHKDDTNIHVSTEDRTNWDSAKTHADSAHAPSNAQENVLETVKVNGSVLTPTDKAVNVTVPTKVAQLTDSVDYAKKTDIPTTLPANGGNADTVNNHTVETDVPTDAVFTDTIYDDTEVKGSIEDLNSDLVTQGFGENGGGSNIIGENVRFTEVTSWDDSFPPNNTIDTSAYFENGAIKTRYEVDDWVIIPFHFKNGVKINYATFKDNAIIEETSICICNLTNKLADITSAKTYTPTSTFDGYICIGKHIKQADSYYPMLSYSAITTYEPYIPSVKMLAEEVCQQNNKIVEQKMLGWNVPSEFPIQNEVSGNQFIQKVDRVDLSKLVWLYATNPSRFLFYLDNIKSCDVMSIANVIVTDKLSVTTFNDVYTHASDNILGVSGRNVGVYASSYTDVESFKNAMKGVYLYYELDTPITITIDGNEVTERINESLSVIGKCKNLLKPTLQTTTQNGVTCTNNGDGTYTLNGTVDSEKYPEFPLGMITLDKGKYLFPNQNSSAFLWCGTSKASHNIVNSRLLSNIFINIENKNDIYITLVCRSGETYDNVVIKPMITTDLSATYDDFVPYTGDGKTLTHDVAEINSNLAYNASKNMLLVNVGTISGVTITSKDKSTALLNGTNTENVGVFVTADVIPSGEYHLKVSNRVGAVYVWDATHDKSIMEVSNEDYNFTLTEPCKLFVGFSVGSGHSFTNFEVSGQLEKGTVATDFVPYNGKSNLELTNDVVSLKNDLSTKIYELAGSELYLCVSGKSCVLTLNGYNLTGSTNFSKLAEYPPYLVARNVVSKEDGVCIFSVDPDGNIGASDLQVASSVTGKMFGEVSWVANI